MTTTDPRARLDEIKARADAATEGPWEAPETILGLPATTVFGPKRRHVLYHTGTHIDAEFVAHARTEHPAMAAALTDVLDKVGGVTGHPDCDPSVCQTKVLANLINYTITEHLPRENA